MAETASIEKAHFVRRLLGGYFLEELFWHSHAGQVSFDSFRHAGVFSVGSIGGRGLFLSEGGDISAPSRLLTAIRIAV
jgi:hypothetical protein